METSIGTAMSTMQSTFLSIGAIPASSCLYVIRIRIGFMTRKIRAVTAIATLMMITIPRTLPIPSMPFWSLSFAVRNAINLISTIAHTGITYSNIIFLISCLLMLYLLIIRSASL